MTNEEFADFAHEALHKLIDLNHAYQDKFKIGHYGQWHYDQVTGLFTFSDDGAVKVICEFEFVGSYASESKSWMWAWANDSMEDKYTLLSQRVRDFGMEHGIQRLMDEYWENACEQDGWEMASLTAVLGNAVGAYMCPDEKGCAFVVFKSIRFATQ